MAYGKSRAHGGTKRSASQTVARRRRGEAGATAIEFAMVASLFMLLLFGLIEFSRFMAVRTGVETASREAARYGFAVGLSDGGVPRYADFNGIRAAGTRLSGLSGLSSGDIRVTYDAGPGSGVIASCPSSGSIDSSAVAPGDRVVVTSTATFTSFVPFLNGALVRVTERRTIFWS